MNTDQKIQVDEIKDAEPYVQINRNELVEMIKNWDKVAFSGVLFSNIQYFCDHSYSRVIQKKKVLQKLTTTRITMGGDYEKRINKILKKQEDEPNFVAEPMKGKEYVFGKKIPLVANKEGQLMVVMIVENHVVPHSIMYHNNEVISKEQAIAKDLLTPAYFTPKDTVGRGTVEPEFDFSFRTLGIMRILKIKIGGIVYKIVD